MTTAYRQRITIAQFESKGKGQSNNISYLKHFFAEIYEIQFVTVTVHHKIFEIVFLIMRLGVVVFHTCFPVMYRRSFNNKTEPIGNTHFKLISSKSLILLMVPHSV